MSKNNKPKSLPGRVIRGTSRAGMGGGAILIALALFLLFKGFGPGGTGSSGSGTGEASPSTSLSKASVQGADQDPEKDASLVAPDSVGGGLTEDEQRALSGSVLTVLIDEYDYLIEIPGNPTSIYRPTALPRVIELAALAKGDTNGIKVRILIRESSRARAEKQIQTELEHSGIHRDAIMMTSEFVK